MIVKIILLVDKKLLEVIPENPVVFLSYEDYFHLPSCVNKPNMRYVDMLRLFFWHNQNGGENFQDEEICFQQDVAAAHTARQLR